MASVSDCEQVLKAAPHFQIPGLPLGELAKAVRRVTTYISRGRIDLGVLAQMRTSIWNESQISKTVSGGLDHVISVDNGASYAELWHQGGNWYGMGGLDADGKTVLKKTADHSDPFMITGILKGMGVEEATARFTQALMGPANLATGGCGCGGSR